MVGPVTLVPPFTQSLCRVNMWSSFKTLALGETIVGGETRACGLVGINLRAKVQYGKTISVRIPPIGELTFRHCQGHVTDTWQYVTSLAHFCGAKIPCII